MLNSTIMITLLNNSHYFLLFGVHWQGARESLTTHHFFLEQFKSSNSSYPFATKHTRDSCHNHIKSVRTQELFIVYMVTTRYDGGYE